jgi:hypothetical protein
MVVRNRVIRPDTVRDYRGDLEVHEGRMQTGSQMAYAGSKLKPIDCPERHRLESQPSSRTGENPPYGMTGRIEETSASYEARSAPRSYPTPIRRYRGALDGRIQPGLRVVPTSHSAD